MTKIKNIITCTIKRVLVVYSTIKLTAPRAMIQFMRGSKFFSVIADEIHNHMQLAPWLKKPKKMNMFGGFHTGTMIFWRAIINCFFIESDFVNAYPTATVIGKYHGGFRHDEYVPKHPS